MNNDERVKMEVQLRNEQRVLNRKYEKEGLTDEILDKQIEINKRRHELDIADESKRVYENFVQ
ncbi:hypothetical protein [uncultured Methanobrevibacter sp.]|uniref:hypothetical protein n=1 Tax=uncultured Methanobrevibacter sp. TaxID=253161 RepID=UPI0025EDA765|nr:hypothetical protein [uncultured Methanobrevibacter sp.]